MAKASGVVVALLAGAGVLVLGGVAFAATRRRDDAGPLGYYEPPPPTLSDDLRLIGGELLRYGGKAVSIGARAAGNVGKRAASKEWNRETALVSAASLPAAVTLAPIKVARGLFTTNKVSPAAAAAAVSIKAQRERTARSIPAVPGVISRPPAGTSVVRGLG
jgi:hypothetical protein